MKFLEIDLHETSSWYQRHSLEENRVSINLDSIIMMIPTEEEFKTTIVLNGFGHIVVKANINKIKYVVAEAGYNKFKSRGPGNP